jgi:2-amino-4-hydroxy-6-hydroxymethyldihydropteridine diphosphokinase
MPSYRVFEVDYVLGLGSNLGSRYANIEAGLALLQAHNLARVVARSPLYDSAPVGPPQPRYLNAAACIASALPPLALLDALLAIEAELGRQRRERWGARTLDLDLLWSAAPFAHARLTLPHPHLNERWFALLPLLDVAPELAPEYAPLLARAGAPQPGSARVATPSVQRHVLHDGFALEARALDLADAVAVVLAACGGAFESTAPALRGGALTDATVCGRSELLVLRGTVASGRELEALATRALEAAESFAFEHAVLLSHASGSYDARLIGRRRELPIRCPITGVSLQVLGPGHVRLDATFSG